MILWLTLPFLALTTTSSTEVSISSIYCPTLYSGAACKEYVPCTASGILIRNLCQVKNGEKRACGIFRICKGKAIMFLLLNQVSSSMEPTYVKSVLRTLTAPLSQAQALLLPLSLLTRTPAPGPPEPLALFASSRSVQGSTSVSGS